MKYCIRLFVILSMMLLPAFASAAAIAPARIRIMDGELLFRTLESGEWLPATINTPLDEGDSLWCPDGSRSELQLSDGTVVRIDGGSQLDLLANEEQFTHLHLASGRLYVRTAQTMARNSLQIDADDTTVVPDARTRFRVDMLAGSQEDVAIFKGSAYVEGSGSRTRVRAGEQISLDDGHQEILPLNPPDSWEEWNKAQDRAQSRSAKADTHLPDELKSYAEELDANGRWERTTEYGMVWRPTTIVYTDWAPYRTGRWIWKGDDYVWISYEPWGWAPYHFGRWAFISAFGWCWVPPSRGDIYWGPGYVGWHTNGSEIGWTPLAPGEIFYGRRYYGRHSINISTTIVNRTTVTYRNSHHRGGLTLVAQNDFLHGRITTAPSNRTGTVSVSVSIGSPRLQPVRETRMPVVKKTPPRVTLPRADHSDHREMKTRFPRVITRTDAPSSTEAIPHHRGKTVIHPVQPPEKPARGEHHAPSAEQHRQPPMPQPSYRQEQHDRRQTATPPPHSAATGTTGSSDDKRREPRQQRDVKQKRVWKVTTDDQATESRGKERQEGSGGRERREQRGK